MEEQFTLQQKVLERLCKHFTSNPGEVRLLYQLSLTVLGSCLSPMAMEESRLMERVQKKLVQLGRDRDGVHFIELYQKLSGKLGRGQSCDRSSLLCFLFLLMPSGVGVASRHDHTQSASFLLQSLNLSSAPPPNPAAHQGPPVSRHYPGTAPSSLGQSVLSRSSGLGSTVYSSTASSQDMVARNTRNTTGMPSGHESTITGGRRVPPFTSTPGYGGVAMQTPAPPTNESVGVRRWAWSSEVTENFPAMDVMARPHPLTQQAKDQDNAVSELALLSDLLYVFQGIDGVHIQYSSRDSAYRLTPQSVVPGPVREQCCKLAELGWFHRKVRRFVDGLDRTRGLVMQSFCVALGDELKEYYRLVAVLEAQLRECVDRGGGVGLTLQRLCVWTQDPKHRLRMLAVLAEMCKHLKGGALVSSVYEYSQNGDPAIRTLCLHILAQVYEPLERVLHSWVCEGELCDSYMEFFICCDESSKPDKLWRSKYSIRTAMLPKFISPALAQKILTIGKSINFLRQLCDDHTPLGSRAQQQLYSDLSSHAPSYKDCDSFTVRTGPVLKALVEYSYKETSHHLLQVMHSKYHLMEHLKALRRYLLLGQGDFINHLMDLMVSYLDQPASVMYQHNLLSILESAVRATNAQYDWPESLKCLDVRKLDLSPGDVGWDVYSLHYHVDGAISTVVNNEAMVHYLQVFNFLWRSKRMEYCLASMWRQQTSSARLLYPIKEMTRVLHQTHLLLSTMIHFINQLQYYINFEVLECNWARLLLELDAAQDLDEVIHAHDHFLQELLSQCLLDSASQPLLTQVRTIYDLVIQFQAKQTDIMEAGLNENNRRMRLQEERNRRAAQGGWAVTRVEEEMEREKRAEFVQEMESFSTDMTLLHESFVDYVGHLMQDLRQSSEQSLQFLRFRLDFNQYYSLTLGLDTSVVT